jgi:hypothetical protein
METVHEIEDAVQNGEMEIQLEHNSREALLTLHLLANWIGREGGTYAAMESPAIQARRDQSIWSLGTMFTREPD